MTNSDFRKRTLLPLVCGCLFAFGFVTGGIQLVLADIAGEFGMRYTAMGSIVTMYFIATLCMPVLFGHLGDKFGKKKVLALAFAFFVSGCLLAMLAQNAGGLYIGMFVMGAGVSVGECMGTAALSDSHPEKSEKNLNLSQSFFSGGSVVSPFIIMALMGAGFSWRIVYISSAVIFLFFIPLLKISTFSVRPPEGGHTLERQPVFSLLKSKILIVLVVCLLIYVGIESGVAYFADSFFTVELGQQSFSAAAISLYWLAVTLSRILFGVLDVNAQKVLTASFGLAAVVLAFLAIGANAPLALALCVVTGFLYGPVWPMLVAQAAKRFTASSGTVTSIMMIGGGAGGAFVPVWMGLVADHADLRWAMGLLVVLAVVAFFCCMLVFRKKQASAAS
jgi:FHS family glucose/mannose:H+ symporter-like MFS transporter